MSRRRAGAFRPLREILGEDLVVPPIAAKNAEHRACQRVIGSRERAYLLLNV